VTTAADGVSGERTPSSRSWPAAAIVAACLLGTFGAAAIGAQFMPGAWYEGLARPPLTPPNWIFGPVWTALYALMGLAAAIVWMKSGWRAARVPLAVYALQLALNSLWSALFFGMHRPDLALVDIVVLWLAIAATMAAFAKHSKLAAAMLAPYLAWVSFATYLNAGFWWLNR
jgi:tryptophan-rich sensory protein